MSFIKKRIYIVVKTYPTISKEYSELVCTAGILEDGSWIRLYPVPFRKLDMENKYPKYSWIEVEVIRNSKDFRPETYRPNLSTLKVVEKAKSVDWEARRSIVFKNKETFKNLEKLISKAKVDKISIAIFKPTKLIDFVVEETDRCWDPEKLAILDSLSRQQNMFQSAEELEKEFKTVPKVPYKFFYKFEDDSGKKSRMMIEDWEIGMLYFNCLKRANGNEETAKAKVREKYFDEFSKRDLYFFLGTSLKYHNVAPNPFMIIGLFTPPMPKLNRQLSIFDS